MKKTTIHVHIVPDFPGGYGFGTDAKYNKPVNTYCGKPVEHEIDWTWASDVAYTDRPLCEDCLVDDDFVLLTLAQAGELSPHPGFISAGVQTGRIPCQPAEMILSPSEYDRLEKELK